MRRVTLSLAVLLLATLGCGGSGGGAGDSGSNRGTNRARFTFELSLQGAPATLVLEVEVVGNTGVTWGPGATPDITGVIGTGSYTVFTSGQLRSAVAAYAFTGENQFADFTNLVQPERFRVQWTDAPRGLRMIVNPFGPGPVAYDCVLVRAEAL